MNQHSLQAPFIYNFYTQTLKKDLIHEGSNAIERLRDELKMSSAEIDVLNLGADSRVNNNPSRPISGIARKGITSAKTSRLLSKIIHDSNAKNIIELGTSLGINTMYLALNKDSFVTSFEGCPATASIAINNIKRLEFENINIVVGNIDTTLPQYLTGLSNTVDFAFIDANHQFGPTINYFNLLYSKSHSNSVFVFDDIHWSSEMSKAWSVISADKRVTLSIDLFELGIVFFNQGIQKSHFRLRL